MAYVTAYAAAVPIKYKDGYVGHVKETAAIFKKYGATRCLECWGEDVPPGDVTSFPLAAKCGTDETVAIGLIEWPSKAIHDQGMPRVMAKMSEDMNAGKLQKPPFDGKRMIFGSFEVIADRSHAN